ncbi:hypothetical protein RYH80_04290 [Halobaculum sp. MBLA0147]|uniref:hypothetical protein n=1 Tax=Halobaculum sp. MBLA0147 TaxID=3079934 RepID=UPI003524E9AB
MNRRQVAVGLLVLAVVVGSGSALAVAGGVSTLGAAGGTAVETGDWGVASLGAADDETVTGNETSGGNETSRSDTNETATAGENETTAGNETVGDDETTTVDENETAETDGETVSAGAGRQLSTVVTVTGESVRESVSNASLTAQFRRANETERAELLATRLTTLQNRSEAVAAEYESLRAAYRADTLSTGEFAHRVALLHARAQTVTRDLARAERLSANVSRLELAAAGYDATVVERVRDRVAPVSGTAPGMLLGQFTVGGNATVRVSNGNGTGLSVAAERGRSREFEREPDENASLTVSGETALATARGALSPAPGNWTLAGSTVDTEDGLYEYAFRLSGTNESGEASVTVDGSSGVVVALEESVGDTGPPATVPGRGPPAGRGDGPPGDRGPGPPDDRGGGPPEGRGEGPPADRGAGADDDEADGDDLALVLAGGEPAANETVTVRLVGADGPVANATVTVDGTAAGQTDADGTADVRLPANGTTTIRATSGNETATLVVESGETDDDVVAGLNASGTVENGTVTVTVTYDDNPVAGVRASVDGQRVGTTGGDGRVSFAADPGTVTVDLRKGQFEARLSLSVDDDSVSVTNVSGSSDERDEGPGRGNGSENGNGNGAGNGNSDGNDDGSGAGNGSENGNGSGNGDDAGNGNGSGNGDDAGNGNGDDAGNGNGNGGNGASEGNGDGSESGPGNGDGSENGDDESGDDDDDEDTNARDSPGGELAIR